jgi:signal peptidase I
VLLGLTRRGAGWALASVLLASIPILPLDSLESPWLITAVLLITAVTGLAVEVGAAVDVARTRRVDASIPPWKRVALPVVVLVVVVGGLGKILDPSNAIRERYFQAYLIPTGAMYPTLLAGDRFFANKFIYRFQNPTRGDVTVFKFPLDEQRDFTKRVIPVGGETLSIRDHRIYINCRPPDLGCQPIADPWGYYEDRLGISSEDFGPVHVPQGSYFVMGDHRNNSQDSRTWGFVKAEAIKGRVALIYWSWDGQAAGMPSWKRVRWDRLGRRVR